MRRRGDVIISNADEIRDANVIKLRLLDAIHEAILQRKAIVEALYNSPTRADGVAAVGRILGVGDEEASAVLSFELSRLTRDSVTRIDEERDLLRRSLSE